MRTSTALVRLASVCLFLVACMAPPVPSDPYTYAVDPSITPSPSTLPDAAHGPRPIAAVEDATGAVSYFIENEVVLAPDDSAELDDFLDRYGGTVLETDAIPAPPAVLNVRLTPEQLEPTLYVVRLDPSGFSLDDIASDAAATGFGGDRTVSSEAGVRLLALLMHERRGGAAVRPNFLYAPDQAMLFRTEEHPVGAGFVNAFTSPSFRFANDLTGSFSSVLRAWQFMSALGVETRVNVAILDRGFWLDNAGRPGSAFADGTSDFAPPATPVLQYDFDDDDYLAGGPDYKNGWHGNQSASVALGAPDNGYGAAGTGGWVADPIMFKVDYTDTQLVRALRTAVTWGADVVSMSFSGNCTADCVTFGNLELFATIQDAIDSGVVLLASAGNDTQDLDAKPKWPCGIPGIFCVGALANGSTNRISYSNYGSDVDVFAPTNIRSAPNPAVLTNTPPLDSATGTSASTPFVAGIAAMIQAVNPSLSSEAVSALIRTTARTDSTDGTVTRYVDAYAAVVAAAGGRLADDGFEPNDSPAAAAAIAPETYERDLTYNGDTDYYTFTVDDFATVDFDLTYMRDLGAVFPSLLQPTDVGPPIGQTTATLREPPLDEGAVVHYPLVAPSTYTVALTGDGPSLYDMIVHTTAAPLAPDAFEANDTPETAAVPASGQHVANLHRDADLDHYRFTISSALNPSLKVFHFGVTFSDRDVELRVFKDGVDLGAQPISKTPSIDVWDAGSYVIRIDAPTTTRYSFVIGEEASQELTGPDFPVPIEDLWFIDPTAAVERWLVQPRETFLLPQNAYQLETFGEIQIVSGALTATLYDLDGAVVAEGQPFAIDDTTSGEALSLADTTDGQSYILVIDRVVPQRVPGAVHPLVAYAMQWQEVP